MWSVRSVRVVCSPLLYTSFDKASQSSTLHSNSEKQKVDLNPVRLQYFAKISTSPVRYLLTCSTLTLGLTAKIFLLHLKSLRRVLPRLTASLKSHHITISYSQSLFFLSLCEEPRILLLVQQLEPSLDPPLQRKYISLFFDHFLSTPITCGVPYAIIVFQLILCFTGLLKLLLK